MPERISVLVVDDSAFMRHTIVSKLLDTPDVEVVGVARDGLEAITKIKELRPRVVTMDVEMPRLNGLQALERVMRECPCPVIMLSSLTREGAAATIQALELGAVDFLCKPGDKLMPDLSPLRDELLAKIRGAAQARATRSLCRRPLPVVKVAPASTDSGGSPQFIVAVGSSTGGPRALVEVFSRMPRGLPYCALVVQHMPGGFTKSLAARLNEVSPLDVSEAAAGDRPTCGAALLAPGDYHMSLGLGGEIKLDKGPRMHGVRPAVDIMMASVAQRFPKRCLGVVLTGMGRDGTEGAIGIRKAGGRVIAESEATAVVYGMPKCVVDAGAADKVSPLESIADEVAIFLSAMARQ